jgi:acyl-CoA dehydrogenase
MAFFQEPARLGNQHREDRVLRSYLARALPPEVRRDIEPSLDEMGELAAGELFVLQEEDRLNEPRLVQWDPWGRRIDRIELTPLWQRARRVACERGVVATAYEGMHGAYSRVHQFALAYLFDPSTDTFTCPLAMTDGAARTLLHHGNAALVERAVPRLTGRDPGVAWTSGQWMTERTGGSDVGLSETVARAVDGGWRLDGTKWFTSAATSEMALTLARPEGNPAGGRGLALFYLETRGLDGLPNGVLVNRLKDKLGTRKLPTAELTLAGALAQPVAGLDNGIKAIAPMLTITRTWNAICSAAAMRRGLALARDYARRRVQFGARVSEKPLHAATFAGSQAEFEAAFHLTFEVVELVGRDEAGVASDADRRLLRLLTPLCKLTTARQVMTVLPEVLEVFGGAGYVEDTGIPRLLRDGQVLPIWEGTTNVLALDAMRALAVPGTGDVLLAHLRALAGTTRTPALVAVAQQAVTAVERALAWHADAAAQGPAVSEAGARGFALTLGRGLALALLARHAQWSIDHERDGRAQAAAVRFAWQGVDRLLAGDDAVAALALGDDRPLAVREGEGAGEGAG